MYWSTLTNLAVAFICTYAWLCRFDGHIFFIAIRVNRFSSCFQTSLRDSIT